jgi:hypothetical protein
MTDDIPAGRNRVGAKALRAVATVVTAEAMGVAARDVSVELSDDDGLLGVSAVTAIALRALDGHQRDSAPALDRAAAAQTTIRDRMLELTGSSVGFVNLRLNTARITSKGRTR